MGVIVFDKFDVLLPCAPKDYNKLPYVMKSVVDNIVGYDGIYVVSPTDIPTDILSRLPYAYYSYLDSDLMPGIDREKWSYRPNWNFQQCLKLFQGVTADWYLTLDCDTFVNRPLSFVEDGKPVYYLGWDQNMDYYFRYQKEMIGIGKVAPFTFIADMNLIYRPFVTEMLNKSGHSVKSFIEKSQAIVNKDCQMAEPELYGSYIWENHRDVYTYKKLKQRGFKGRVQKERDNVGWNEKEIADAIAEERNQDIDTFSLHSWFVERGME